MVIKSLTITETAYNALKAAKYGNESFSDVIVRLSSEKVGAASKFFGAMKMSKEEKEDLITKIKERRKEIDKEFKQREEYMRKRLSHAHF